jgi:hypothetical protein
VALFALSYDESDALAAFATEFEIGYPLLSDPQSDVIRGFGILNTLIGPDEHPWYGIPFPGVYVTDASGTITAKFFESHLALRPGIDQLIRAAQAETVDAGPAATPVAEVEVSVAIDDAPTPPGILRELRVHLRVPPGQHLYGEPTPSGLIPTSIQIDPVDQLLTLPPRLPATHPHTLRESGEVLQVYEGDVEIRVPFTLVAPLVADGSAGALPVSGTVRWQSCDDRECFLPASADFAFEIPLGKMNTQHRGEAAEGQMDFAAHFQRMVQRRQ